jgi:hypothetical protein
MDPKRDSWSRSGPAPAGRSPPLCRPLAAPAPRPRGSTAYRGTPRATLHCAEAVGAETFADYRAQLLPWAECEARLPAYCASLGIPEQGEDFAAVLKAELTTLAAAVDGVTGRFVQNCTLSGSGQERRRNIA